MNHRSAARRAHHALVRRLAVGTATGVLLLALVTPGTVAAARAPGTDGSAFLAALALGAAWLVAARLALLTVTAVAALAPGAFGRSGAWLAVRVTPSLLRRTVVVAVGAGTVLPAVTGPAFASPPPDLPRLDRVVSWPAQAAVVEGSPVPTAGPPSTQPPPEPPAPTTRAPGGSSGPLGTVVVRPGDTLWAIAASHLPPRHRAADVARAWPRWYARNRALVGADPGLLRPGERLVAPASDAEP